MDTLSSKVRRTLLAVAENESLFFWMIFLEEVMLCNGLFINYIEQIKLLRSHIILPWGMTLCALRLCRREQKNSIRFTQWDVRFLVVLLLWMVVPFAVRFGFTPYRIVMMQGTAIIFFGLYAKLTEECVQQRERLLDQVSALFAVLSFVYGSALFYCVLTGQVFGEELGDMAFGVGADGMLYGGVYYNVTGMMANCCGLMSLVGFSGENTKLQNWRI